MLGLQGNLTSEFQSLLRKTGTMHVVVASGTNITFIAGYLLYIFTPFFGRRKAVFWAGGGIIFYIILAGFQAPIIRAGIMGGFALLSIYFGRQYYGLLSLIITILLMILINPKYAVDIGFQLSALATFSLLTVRPYLLNFKLIKLIERNRIFGEALITAVSMQIMIYPLIFFYFGQISIISLIVNPLVLWVIPILMVLGILIFIFGFIYFPLAQIISYFAFGFLYFFTQLVSFFGKWKLWGMEVSTKPSLLLIGGYYLLLFSYFWHKKLKR